MAWLGIIIIFIFMDTQDHTIYCVWIHFIPTTYTRGEKKNIWSELESNARPLASHVTDCSNHKTMAPREIQWIVNPSCRTFHEVPLCFVPDLKNRFPSCCLSASMDFFSFFAAAAVSTKLNLEPWGHWRPYLWSFCLLAWRKQLCAVIQRFDYARI